jgi:hypothetical protein
MDTQFIKALRLSIERPSLPRAVPSFVSKSPAYSRFSLLQYVVPYSACCPLHVKEKFSKGCTSDDYGQVILDRSVGLTTDRVRIRRMPRALHCHGIHQESVIY